MITGLYAALLVVFQYALTINVVMRRREAKVSLGDGGDAELQRRIRTHANFVEAVPIVLILMIIAELSGAPYWAVHIVGLSLVIARSMHVIAIMKSNLSIRVPAMLLTLFSGLSAAVLCVWQAVPAIFG